MQSTTAISSTRVSPATESTVDTGASPGMTTSTPWSRARRRVTSVTRSTTGPGVSNASKTVR